MSITGKSKQSLRNYKSSIFNRKHINRTSFGGDDGTCHCSWYQTQETMNEEKKSVCSWYQTQENMNDSEKKKNVEQEEECRARRRVSSDNTWPLWSCDFNMA